MTDKEKRFEEAYQADKRMREVREEELQAAKDYLNVLLEEMAGRNQELEETKRDAAILKNMLVKTEEEIEGMRKENIVEKKKGRVAACWMVITFIELALIIALVVILFMRGSDTAETVSPENQLQNGENVKNHQIADNIIITEPEIKTEKYIENLVEKLETLDEQSIAPFTASVEKISGSEYLCFTYNSMRVCYRNEYYFDEMSFRKSIIIDNGRKRVQYNKSYNLDESLEELCPKLCNFKDVGEVIVFAGYESGESQVIPKELQFVNCQTLEEYEIFRMKDRIRALISTSFVPEETEDGEQSAKRMILNLKTSKAEYKYAVSEAEYNEIEYNEYEVPEFDTNFHMIIKEDTIEWSTYVCMSETYYLGEMTGVVGIDNGRIVIKNAKYGAFVPANQEDEELKGVIIPSNEVPENYVTIMGMNNERYLIRKSETVDMCTYDWSNLDISDVNDWKYKDEGGRVVSIRGIDVSKYQSKINWSKVKEAGIEYAIIRLGYRGYNEGTLEIDPYYKTNIEGAVKAGVKVGVYFFSQAITEEEAEEEAEFVLKNIKEYEITYPVVFDTERVAADDARANSLSWDERTKMCISFCDKIREAGYKPMIYANTKYMIMGIDLERLSSYDKWFAFYGSEIKFPYNFQMLQYSDTGSIPGIEGNVDLNISFVDYSEKK